MAEETKRGAGQYFTPRVLIDVMVQLMQPQPGEVIQDPAAGTGGFLIAADRRMREEHDDYFELAPRQQAFQLSEAFRGLENVPDTYRLLLMTLHLHKIDSDHIRLADTLSPRGSDPAFKSADVIKGPITAGYWVEPGDLLVGMDGDFNVRRWQADRGLLNQRVCKIIADRDQYCTSFLEYALPGYLRLINRMTSSVTVKHLSSRTLAEIPLPLPPLPEQHRIVAKLDTLTARIARARVELERVPVLTAHMRYAALHQAFRGELTAVWRSAHQSPKSVSARRSEEIRSKYRGGDAVPEPYSLPPYWRWMRLPELGDLDRGKSRHRPVMTPPSSAALIRSSKPEMCDRRDSTLQALLNRTATWAWHKAACGKLERCT